jgi:hypothetical protein
MDIDWKAEIRRPVTIALAIVAIVGWVAMIAVWSSESSLRASSDAQIAQLQTEHQQLADQLAAQQKASGTLVDLQHKAEAASAAAADAGRQHDAAAAALTTTSAALATARQQLADTQSRLKAADDALGRAHAAGADAEARLAHSQAEATRLDQVAASRTHELADIGKRIDAAHAEEAQTRQALAQLTQESAGRSADITRAETALQQTQQAAAQLQTQLVSGDRVNPSGGDTRNPSTLRSRESQIGGGSGRFSTRHRRAETGDEGAGRGGDDAWAAQFGLGHPADRGRVGLRPGDCSAICDGGGMDAVPGSDAAVFTDRSRRVVG